MSQLTCPRFCCFGTLLQYERRNLDHHVGPAAASCETPCSRAMRSNPTADVGSSPQPPKPNTKPACETSFTPANPALFLSRLGTSRGSRGRYVTTRRQKNMANTLAWRYALHFASRSTRGRRHWCRRGREGESRYFRNVSLARFTPTFALFLAPYCARHKTGDCASTSTPIHFKNPSRQKAHDQVECAHFTLCYGIIYSTSSINKIGKMRLSGLIPVLLSLAALVLSFLCLFAGSKRGVMDEYAVVTVSVFTFPAGFGKTAC